MVECKGDNLTFPPTIKYTPGPCGAAIILSGYSHSLSSGNICLVSSGCAICQRTRLHVIIFKSADKDNVSKDNASILITTMGPEITVI